MAILSELREIFPQARYVFMYEETFREHRELCVDEPKSVKYIPERLTRKESGKNLRLEQERIGMSFAMRKLREVFRWSRVRIC